MNWTWNIRTRDGAMNGLGFACCTTAGGLNWGLLLFPWVGFMVVRVGVGRVRLG